MVSILPAEVVKARHGAAFVRAFRLLRRLPLAEGAHAWLSLGEHSAAAVAADFLLIDADNRAWLIAVGEMRAAEVADFVQPGLFEVHAGARQRFDQLQSRMQKLAEFSDQVPRVLLLPGVDSTTATALAERLPLPEEITVIGGEAATDPDMFAACLQALQPKPLPRKVTRELRERFTPECRIPESFVPRLRRNASDRGDRFTECLLDFDQEAWVKDDLLLDDRAGDLAQSRARLITGVAGSGKSLALLYRARILAGLSPNRRFLFTTHNKPLIADLEWRFNVLAKHLPAASGTAVVFQHFYRWCGKVHYDAGQDVITDLERIERIRKLALELFADSSLPTSFFVDEVAFLADFVDDSEATYLASNRAGRGVALDPAQRRRLHRLYRRYRTELAANRQTDWYLLIRTMHERVLAGTVKLPRYDVIFVDEGQFFAPLWFDLLKRSLAPGGEIIVAADPTQGFLKRRQSWSSMGLEVRGRATRLERSYRNVHQLQIFARRFFQQRNPDDNGEEIFLPLAEDQSGSDSRSDTDGVEITAAVGGVHLFCHPTPQDAAAWMAETIARAIDREEPAAVPPEAILVIHQDRGQLDAIATALKDRISPSRVARLDHRDPARGAVGLTTLGSATGMERPIVFLAGLDALFGAEQDPRLDPNERAEMIRDHTRMIYMALTRAGQHLLISHQSEATARLLRGRPEAPE